MDATVASGAFEGSCRFTGQAEPHSGPGAANAATRETLQWSPKYSSFQEFMQRGAKDVFQTIP